MNRLSLPEATKRTLRRTCRTQAQSWPCCCSAYQRSSLHSAFLCPGGAFTPSVAWSCPRLQGGWRDLRGARWLFTHQSRLLKEPSIFFRNIFKWSFSVCEWLKSWGCRWERQFPPLKLSTKMPNPLFSTRDSYFPVTFDIPLCPVLCNYMFTHKHKYTANTPTQ